MAAIRRTGRRCALAASTSRRSRWQLAKASRKQANQRLVDQHIHNGADCIGTSINHSLVRAPLSPSSSLSLCRHPSRVRRAMRFRRLKGRPRSRPPPKPPALATLAAEIAAHSTRSKNCTCRHGKVALKSGRRHSTRRRLRLKTARRQRLPSRKQTRPSSRYAKRRVDYCARTSREMLHQMLNCVSLYVCLFHDSA